MQDNTQTGSQQQYLNVPAEIKKWNWGAFMNNIFWGIGNKTYLPLLCLVPIFNIVWIFICGAKGNEWAWKDGNYTDVALFQKVQESWNRAGFVQFIIFLSLFVIYFIFGIIIGIVTASLGNY